MAYISDLIDLSRYFILYRLKKLKTPYRYTCPSIRLDLARNLGTCLLFKTVMNFIYLLFS